MAFIRSLIVFAALAVAVGSRAHVEAIKISDFCGDLKSELAKHSELKEGDEIFKFVKNWVESNSWAISNKRLLLRAWDNIYNNKDCHSQSFEDLFNLVVCQAILKLDFLNESVNAYAQKCLTSEHTNQKVKLGMTGFLAKKVDFLDSHFIERYYEENPEDPPIHLDSRGVYYLFPEFNEPQDNDKLNCCKPKASHNTLLDAIERDLEKRGKKPENEFHHNAAAVTSYLTSKLFKPCRAFTEQNEVFVRQLLVVSTLYKGGQEALIASLDEDAKENLFRYKYCKMLKRDAAQSLEKMVKDKYV